MDLPDLSLAALAVATVAVYALLIPARFRMWVAIGIGLVWWSMFRADGLPLAGALSELRLLPLALIALTALAHTRFHGPVRITRSATAYLWIAAGSSVVVLSVLDLTSALTARFTWAATIFAALCVLRAFNPAEDVHRLVATVAGASAAFTAICVWGLAADPSSLSAAYGRFDPWGINPNGIGALLGIGSGALYVTGQQHPRWRVVTWPLIATNAGLIALTASRGNLLLLGVALLPLLVVTLRRRPLVAFTVASALAVGAWYAVSQVNPVRFERLRDLESARGMIRDMYWQVVQERPVAGLLFSDGQTAHTLNGFPLDEHNAYLRLLYLGGLLLFVPVAVISVMALGRGWRWVRATRGTEDYLGVLFLVSTLAGLFVYSYTNRLIYEPVGVLPFLHALLVALALQFGRLGAAVVGDEAERRQLGEQRLQRRVSAP